MSEKKVFSGASIEECLRKASDEFSVQLCSLKHEVIEEKKGLFKKTYTVRVELKEQIDNDGKVFVEDGSIKVKNPKTNGRKATISSSNQIKIIVDGEFVGKRVLVTEESDIQWESINQDGSREINISLNDNRTEAIINLEFEPSLSYKIKECGEMTDLIPGCEVDLEVCPKAYTTEEVVKLLKKAKITKGVILDSVNKILNIREKFDIKIAQGEEAVIGTDDKLIVHFNENKIPIKDEKGNVDYKSIGHVDNIKSGDVLCELIKGDPEKNGLDVYGKEIKAESKKRISIIAGKGCRLVDNKIVAEIAGKAIKKGYTFLVEPVFVINGNVDLSTGDIKFEGNVEVFGEVTEGMKVESGSSIEIHQGASGAEIKSQKNINIIGNILTSKVASGGDDVFRRKIYLALSELKIIINELNAMAIQVSEAKLLGENISLGEVYKILIERRFKKLSLTIEEYENLIRIEYGNINELIKLLKSKFSGLGPITIKDPREIDKTLELLEDYLDSSTVELDCQSDIIINYIQDSKVECNGDIFIKGKGEYVSEIISNGSIYFGDESVARGGLLRARNEVRCNIVGSAGRVRTTVQVEAEGRIYIQKAFINTKIIVGKVERVLDEDVVKVLAYLDDSGELMVEKLKE